MRFSRLPLAIGAATIALGGLITPTATAADLSINNDICEISFTDGEITFFQSKFKQARVDLITSLKDEIPAATAELDELQELADDVNIKESNVEFFERFRVLEDDIAAKGASAGFKDGDEVKNLLSFLWSLVSFENLGIHFWAIFYDHDTELLELPTSSADTVLEFMNLPFEIDEALASESEVSAQAAEIIKDILTPLKSLRAPFTPVFEACANGQTGTIIGDEVEDAPGNDVPGDKQEPAERSNSSSFGSS